MFIQQTNMNYTEQTNELILKDAINQFIFHCRYEKSLNSKTITAYKTDLKQFQLFIKRRGISDNLYDIDRNSLKLYIQFISNFKPKTTKRKLASLKAMYSFIEFENEFFTNPFHKIKVRIKESSILPTVMNIDDVTKIFKSIYSKNKGQTRYKSKEQVRNIAIFELLFSTGIRVSELCNLRCSDVDFTNGSIKVLGKGRKERIIHVCQKEVLDILKSYYQLFKPTSYFFINRLQNQISTQSVRLLVKKYVKLANIDKKITPHTFRHTFATLLLEEDVDIKYIQNLLGHSSIATTQIYTHVSSQKQKTILSTKHPRLKLSFE